MGYSRKRFKQLLSGKVQYCIYRDDVVEFSSTSFKITVQYLDSLQKQNPGVKYEMKLMEVNK